MNVSILIDIVNGFAKDTLSKYTLIPKDVTALMINYAKNIVLKYEIDICKGKDTDKKR